MLKFSFYDRFFFFNKLLIINELIDLWKFKLNIIYFLMKTPIILLALVLCTFAMLDVK